MGNNDQLTEFDVRLGGACGLLALLQFLDLATVALGILRLLPEVIVLNQLALKQRKHTVDLSCDVHSLTVVFRKKKSS